MLRASSLFDIIFDTFGIAGIFWTSTLFYAWSKVMSRPFLALLGVRPAADEFPSLTLVTLKVLPLVGLPLFYILTLIDMPRLLLSSDLSSWFTCNSSCAC